MKILGVKVYYKCYKECALQYLVNPENCCVLCSYFESIDIPSIMDKLIVLNKAAFDEGEAIKEVKVCKDEITNVLKKPYKVL